MSLVSASQGKRAGRSTVSRVAKRLDGAVHEPRQARIDGVHRYLYLDATILDARWVKVEKRRAPGIGGGPAMQRPVKGR